MPRTYLWSEATPAGADDANTIDDAIRRLRLEIREIVDQIIGVDITTALQDPILSYPASNYLLKPGASAAFYPATYAQPTLTVGGYIEWSQAIHGASGAVVFDLAEIPVGATITKLELFMSSDSASSAVTALNLISTKLAAGAAVIAATAFGTAMGAFSAISTVVEGSHTPVGGILLDGTTAYAVEVNFNGPAASHVRVHGLLVTYTRPDTSVIR